MRHGGTDGRAEARGGTRGRSPRGDLDPQNLQLGQRRSAGRPHGPGALPRSVRGRRSGERRERAPEQGEAEGHPGQGDHGQAHHHRTGQRTARVVALTRARSRVRIADGARRVGVGVGRRGMGVADGVVVVVARTVHRDRADHQAQQQRGPREQHRAAVQAGLPRRHHPTDSKGRSHRRDFGSAARFRNSSVAAISARKRERIARTSTARNCRHGLMALRISASFWRWAPIGLQLSRPVPFAPIGGVSTSRPVANGVSRSPAAVRRT
ncbi:hypothetical protein CLV72_1011057 [Allonocardiopsis opalescens]|uniref:Uncharacterized protein n=1 Tax=Allonocardiopsis opalescens TaxID=1144618 RepID=A0A2T0QEY2_9ACTN|nr:hypothetical protein CLV72_1011057 [Allonocardiopsis opalescens]